MVDSKFILEVISIQIRLKELFGQINSEDLLIYLCHLNNLGKGDYYEDYTPGSNHLIAEFIGMYFMFMSVKCDTDNDVYTFLEGANEFQKLSEILLARQSLIRDLDKKKTASIDEDNLSTISNKLRRDSAVVKNPGFPFHHEEIMLELFEKYEKEIEDIIGYNYSDTIEVIRAVPEYIEKYVGDVYEEFHNRAKKVEKEILFFRKKRKLKKGSSVNKEFADSFKTVSNKDLLKAIKYNTFNYVVSEIIDKYVIKTDRLQPFTSISKEKVGLILRSFSLDKSHMQFYPDPSYGIIPFVEYPYINVSGGFIIPSIRNITWAASIRIEKVIKNAFSIKKYEKYKKYKHDKLLSISMEYFKILIDDFDLFLENAYYKVEGNQCEVDGLIKFDNKLLVIEFKSHELTDPARRGYESRVQKHLDEIVVHPYKQAVRCIQYIESCKEAIFEDEVGNQISFNTSEINEIIPISITLAQLGHITSGLKKSPDSEYFNHKLYPWTVNIYDLKIICDLLRNSAELVDFIRERSKFMEDHKVQIYDELDIFAYYLDRQLNSFQKIRAESNFDWGYLLNATDEINHYYFNQYGDYYRGEVGKPNFKLPDSILPIITKLLSSKVENRIDACTHIFSMDYKSITMYVKRLGIILKSNKKSRSHHDFTVASLDVDGFNIAISVIIDSVKDRLLAVSKFIEQKRINDPKIKSGFIVKLLSTKSSYRVVEIKKYATNT